MAKLNKIKQRRIALEKRATKIHEEMEALKASCPHENVDKKYQSDTGNWSKGDDSYWIDFKCPDCDKRWMEDQ